MVKSQGICFGAATHFKGKLLAGKGKKLFFYRRQVFLGKTVVTKVNIVVEPIFNGGSNGEFRFGVKRQDCLRQNMGRGVPKSRFPFVVIPSKQAQISVFFDEGRRLYRLLVELSR